jgi:hypothetical protein
VFRKSSWVRSSLTLSLVGLVGIVGALAACDRNDGQNQPPNNGYNPNGGYNPNNPNGGYNPNNPNGGYNPNNPNGGYNPNNPNGGYNPNNPNGGYNPNNPNGGYNPNNPNGGYPAPTGTVPPSPPATGTAAPAPPATGPIPGLPPAPSGFPWPWPSPAPSASNGGNPAPAPSNGSAGPAQQIDPTLAGVATVPLMAFAQQQAPGMQREGNVLAGQFKDGQTLEQAFQMLPNKCYTVLAVGAGPQEVDIQLVALTPVPNMSPTLAQDSGTGSSASLGGGGNCFKWNAPFGINAKFVVKSTRGSGVIASQLYSK